MGLLRTVDAELAVIQRRAFCWFTSSGERSEQMPDPEIGTVSFIPPASYEYWTGTDWEKFPPP